MVPRGCFVQTLINLLSSTIMKVSVYAIRWFMTKYLYTNPISLWFACSDTKQKVECQHSNLRSNLIFLAKYQCASIINVSMLVYILICLLIITHSQCESEDNTQHMFFILFCSKPFCITGTSLPHCPHSYLKVKGC